MRLAIPESKCFRCDGAGWIGPGTKHQDLPAIHKPIGIQRCYNCKGTGIIGGCELIIPDSMEEMFKGMR